MRIVVIAADLIPEQLGGAEMHIVEVIKRLSFKGHQINLFVGPLDEIKKAIPKTIRVHSINYLQIPNLYGISYIISACRQLVKRLKPEEIDIVWARQVYPQAVVGAIIKKKFNKPLYVTAQNPKAYKEELVIKGPFPLKAYIPEILTPLLRWSLKQADLVAAVSTYSETAAKSLGAPRTMVIPNGVDYKKFRIPNSEFRKNSKRIKIITTSALIPRNGVDTLIKAVSFLPKKINWELIIAGDGPELKKLKVQILKLKLKDKIKLIGRVPNEKIPELLSQADIYIRLSRKEGFGVSFLEAMASGLPVIATEVGGIVDFIKDSETGLLVPPDDMQSASLAILRLIDHPKLYHKLQKNALRLVRKKYNWDRITDEIEKAMVQIT